MATLKSANLVEKETLEQAIDVLEAQRALLGDAVVEAAIAPMREKLAALEAAEQPEQQRKLATILFVDIAGHTALTHQLDPEEQMEIIDRALARLAEPVGRYGGHVTRYQGDGFKAVFGLPTAGERDPDHAIHAALAIQAIAGEVAAELEHERGLAGFAVRAGIATGLVFAGGLTEGEDTVKGEPVNLAARLEQAAQPGSVLIAHSTYQHVRGVFDLQALEPIQAKGFAEPVPVYRVLAARARSFRTQRRGVQGVATRMVGRELELLQLQKAFQEMLDGERQFVTIVGEPGLGKSRLLYELEDWVDRQPVRPQLYRGRARLETQRQPYGLLRDLFAFYFDIRDDDPAERVRQKMQAGIVTMAGNSAESAMKAHVTGQLLGYDFSASPHIQAIKDDAQQLRDRALVYLGEYFQAAAAAGPVMLLLEDLHWSDDSSLDMLLRLALALPERRALFVASARPELYGRRPNWMEGQPFHRRLELRPLSGGDSRLLLAEVLQKVDDIPDVLRDLVVANAEGNPFYVEELVKMLIDDGVIITGAERWRVLPEKVTALHVPATLTGVLQARLDALPEAERALLQQASVVGRVFWDAVVAYLNEHGQDGLADEAIGAGLAALRGKELVYRRELSAFAGANEHIFKHAVLRQVTYESVLKRARRGYHSLVAEWLIEHGGERAGEMTGLIAEHLALAGKTTAAAVYLRRAGEEAAARYANEEAVAYFSRALELRPEEDREGRWALLLAREKVLDLLGRRPAQTADLDALEALAEQLADPGRQVEVALRHSELARYIRDNSQAVAAAERAIELAQAAGDRGREAAGHVSWGWALIFQDQAAAEQGQQALALARAAGRAALQAQALNILGWTASLQGDYPTALDRFEQALAITRQVGDRRQEGGTLHYLGMLVEDKGDYPRALSYYEQSLDLARQVGDRWGEGTTIGMLGNIAARLGDYVTARDHYEQALAVFRQVGDQVNEAWALAKLGHVATRLGDYPTARSTIEQALAIYHQVGGQGYEGWALGELGDALAGLGQWQEAIAYFEAAIALGREPGRQPLLLRSLTRLAAARLAQGDSAGARAAVDEVLAHLDAGGSFEGTEHELRNYLVCAQVLQASGDPRAGELLEKAHTMLQARAARIANEDGRRAYLENVPWHRKIVTLWQAQRLRAAARVQKS